MAAEDFAVSGFKSKFKTGGARPNLFNVRITGGQNTGKLNNLQFLAKGASLPASTIGSIDVPYFGRQIKVSGDRTYENFTITVLNTEEFGEHTAFVDWMEALNGGETNLRRVEEDNYKAVINVDHFDKSGNVNRSYVLQGAFPVSVGAVELAWDSNDQLEEFTVELAYDYYTTGAAKA